jgi:hydantoinase/carbamoylase family amidase
MSPLPDFRISTEHIEEHYHVLAQIGNLGPSRLHGFLRASWSFEETAAVDYIREVGESHGLESTYDGIGNLYLSTPGRRDRLIQVGSHLDTVPIGGLYDGSAGIVAGLEAILALKTEWSGLTRGLELVAWRGEESATFGAVCKGSQAAFGLNDPKILGKEFEGKTLEEAILSQGFDPRFIAGRKPTLSQERIDAIDAHLELHIEQANRLEVNAREIGIATSIRGTVRLRVVVTGEAAHSGATPMGSRFRKDANLAMAYMQVGLDRLAHDCLSKGHDLVQTVGLINADPSYNLHDPRVYENALTKVSPFGYFAIDIRSNNSGFLQDYLEDARRMIQEIGAKYEVGVSFDTITSLPPLEELDRDVQDEIEAACRENGLSFERMPSGALHDVAVVSSQRHSNGMKIPGGLIFIPCLNGISHNPREYASAEAIQKGASVLASTLYRLAKREQE